MNARIFCACLTIHQTLRQTQDARRVIIYLDIQEKTATRTLVKLTQDYSFFHLTCSVLEIKMSSNSAKLDSAMKCRIQSGHLKQADVVKNAAVR